MSKLREFFRDMMGERPPQVPPRIIRGRKGISSLFRLHDTPAQQEGAVYKKGDYIGKTYEVFGVLGVGGFSVVYLVYSHENETAYALKTLRDRFLEDDETREQFRKEAKMWVDLERHPYIVTANFIDELGGRLYIGMDYIAPSEEGLNSLEGYLARRAPDFPQTLRWSIQFCHGMEYAHSKGIRCHRDIKPANIMVTADRVVKITDFGFADVIDVSRHRQGADQIVRRRRGADPHGGFGTPIYMPPEQFMHAARCDERSDIYSFGVVLYQMASFGRLPFQMPPREQGGEASRPDLWREMHRLHTEAPVAPLASPLFPLVQRCLQKEQSKRYQTFKELRRDLESLLRRATGEVITPTKTKEMKAWELYNKAFSLGSLGHLQEAIAIYDKVLALEPKNSDAWNNKGVCLRKLGRKEEALRCYDHAIRAERHNASAWSNRGNVLQMMGRFAEAIASLNKAIEVDPLNESAWLNKATVEERLGLRQEAVASYQRFLELKPVEYAAHIDYARKRLAELTGGRRPQ